MREKKGNKKEKKKGLVFVGSWAGQTLCASFRIDLVLEEGSQVLLSFIYKLSYFFYPLYSVYVEY